MTSQQKPWFAETLFDFIATALIPVPDAFAKYDISPCPLLPFSGESSFLQDVATDIINSKTNKCLKVIDLILAYRLLMDIL